MYLIIFAPQCPQLGLEALFLPLHLLEILNKTERDHLGAVTSNTLVISISQKSMKCAAKLPTRLISMITQPKFSPKINGEHYINKNIG